MKAKSSVQAYVYQVVMEDKKGITAAVVRLFLSVLEFIYKGLLHINFALTSKQTLPVAVISVGNLTAGGTGKTPTVIGLAKQFIAEGWHPAILTRGYHRDQSEESICFRSKDLQELSPHQTGDEPYLLAKLLPETLIAVGRDRYQTGLKALAIDPHIDLFILDDGFQHWALTRRFDLVLMDATAPFGNGHLIPRGILREPPPSLKRANIIILTRSMHRSESELASVKEHIRRYSQAFVAIAIQSTSRICSLAEWASGSKDHPAAEIVKNRSIAVVTAIGNPRQFVDSLQDKEAKIGFSRFFPDHYLWNESDLTELLQMVRDHECSMMIVTAKDAVKMLPLLNKVQGLGEICQVLSLEFNIKEANVCYDKIIERLNQNPQGDKNK